MSSCKTQPKQQNHIKFNGFAITILNFLFCVRLISTWFLDCMSMHGFLMSCTMSPRIGHVHWYWWQFCLCMRAFKLWYQMHWLVGWLVNELINWPVVLATTTKKVRTNYHPLIPFAYINIWFALLFIFLLEHLQANGDRMFVYNVECLLISITYNDDAA